VHADFNLLSGSNLDQKLRKMSNGFTRVLRELPSQTSPLSSVHRKDKLHPTSTLALVYSSVVKSASRFSDDQSVLEVYYANLHQTEQADKPSSVDWHPTKAIDYFKYFDDEA
jgi:hypothetical protein